MAPGPDHDVAAELAELRRRAYGPDADIHRDPAALARLDALEAAVTGEETVAVVPPRHQTAETDTEDTARSDAAAETATPARPSRRRLRQGIATAILGATIVGAVAGAAVAVVLAPAPARVDLVLGPDPAADATTAAVFNGDWLELFQLRREDLRGFTSYRGYRGWLARSADGLDCMLVTADDRGLVARSCTAPGVPPVADFDVGNGTTSLGGGGRTVVRFQVHDDSIEVIDRYVAPS